MEERVKCICCGSTRTIKEESNYRCKDCGYRTKFKHVGVKNEKEVQNSKVQDQRFDS